MTPFGRETKLKSELFPPESVSIYPNNLELQINGVIEDNSKIIFLIHLHIAMM